MRRDEAKNFRPSAARGSIEVEATEPLSPDVGHCRLEHGQVLHAKLIDGRCVVATQTLEVFDDDDVEGVQIGHDEVHGAYETCGVAPEHDVVDKLALRERGERREGAFGVWGALKNAQEHVDADSDRIVGQSAPRVHHERLLFVAEKLVLRNRSTLAEASTRRRQTPPAAHVGDAVQTSTDPRRRLHTSHHCIDKYSSPANRQHRLMIGPKHSQLFILGDFVMCQRIFYHTMCWGISPSSLLLARPAL